MKSCFTVASDFTEHRVWGLKMYPLTVGHCFVLDEAISPFSGQIDRITLDDVLTAALVCSQPTGKQAGKLLGIRFLPLLIRYWGFRQRKAVPLIEAERFNQYWESQQQPAPIKTRPSGGIVGSPWHYSLLSNAMGEIGIDYTTAVNMPVWRLRSLLVARQECVTDIKLWTPKDLALFQAVEEMEKEKANN